MFINPTVAINEGWITLPTNNEKLIQPNAIDFTLDRLFKVKSDNPFIISEQGKQMRGADEMQPVASRQNPTALFWRLYRGFVYDGLSDMYVKVPEGIAAMLVIRSSLSRNGLMLASGLYDSGFEGHIGFLLHNRGGQADIGVGTRVGQIIFVESKNALLYEGGYNHSEGTIAPHQQ